MLTEEVRGLKVQNKPNNRDLNTFNYVKSMHFIFRGETFNWPWLAILPPPSNNHVVCNYYLVYYYYLLI